MESKPVKIRRGRAAVIILPGKDLSQNANLLPAYVSAGSGRTFY
jgi:hypothetical protein